MTDESSIPILLVDDRPENLIALEAILDAPDYRLVRATSGEEALARALREDFAAILLDVSMPQMSGFEVAEYLQQRERTRHVPILFVTAVATDVAHIYEAFSVGAVDFLIKPLDARIVRSKVRVFVELYRQRRRIERQAGLLREAEGREHALRMTELRSALDARYRTLVEGVEDVVAWSADLELDRLTFVSRQAPRVLGYSMERLVEPGFFFRLVQASEREAFCAAVQRARERRAAACDHQLVAADGTARWFHTGLSVVEEPLGGPAALHGLSVDVTELKHATRAREELLAIVSHDLKNPLHTIGMSAHVLSAIPASAPLGAVGRRAIDSIQRASRGMGRLLADLVDLERIDRSQLRIEPQPCEVGSLLSDVAAVLEPLAQAKSIELVISVEARDERLWCDRDRLVQVFSNLVGNALKFSPPNGKIVVSAKRASRGLRFSVKDEGPGITAEALPHVFDRFWQADESDRKGLGLGLAIAKGIVDAHGGEIGVESEVGRGATFWFVVPLVERSAAARSAPSRRDHAP